MALSISLPVVTPPTATVATGRADFDVTGVSGSATFGLYVLPANTLARPIAYPVVPFSPSLQNLAPGDYRVDISYPAAPATPTEFASATFTIPAYVAPPLLDGHPASVTAAHLPMLFTVRVAPSGSPLVAAILLFVAEVRRGSAWVLVGRERKACDPLTNAARFDASEYVKTQFSQTPPDESGNPDPALGIAYRVRWGLLPDFDGTDGTEAEAFTGLAVNASEVVNPSLGPTPFPLLNLIPYASVPRNTARFFSIATDAGVVAQSSIPVVAADWPCAVRQFVWLHPSGAWAWGFFAGRHDHGEETGDGTVVRGANGVRRYVSRGDVGEVLSVYSDKVDYTTYQHLRSVRTSLQVYERLASGLYRPVLVEAGSYPGYKETDKTFEVNFTVRYPVLARQTQ